jgi:hypothetical protein
LKLELTSSETAEIELQAQPSSQQAYALRMIIINQSINQSTIKRNLQKNKYFY